MIISSTSYEELQRENKELREENFILKQQIAVLISEQNRIKDLLNVNSNNSSLPPSMDIKRTKYEKSPKPTSGRKRGGQVGRSGRHRPLLPLEKVNDVQPIYPQKQCICGGEIHVNRRKIHKHQVTELPEIKPHVTEYQLYSGTCSCCGKKARAKLPEGVGRNAFGPRILALFSQLVSDYKMTRSSVQTFAKSWLNVDISLGCISESEEIVANSLKSGYDNLKAKMLKSEHLNIDETSYKQSSKLCWAWSFSNKELNFIHIAPSRGKKIVQELLNGYSGQITSDRYAAYNLIDTSDRQICWAHLIRDFRRKSNSFDPKISKIGGGLLKCSTQVFEAYHKYKAGGYLETEKTEFLEKIEKIRKILELWLRVGQYGSMPETIQRFCNNIEKLLPALWLFSKSNGKIEPTNNLAEQDIRHLVIWRKICYGSKSKRGTEFAERLISIRGTCKKLGVSFTEFLIKAMNAHALGKNCIIEGVGE